jgi:hypothetical protein
MDMRTLYPERREFLDSYDVDEIADRLDEILAYGQPITVTDTGCGPWVMLPAWRYDDLVAAMVACNDLIEQRRQAVEPLPPL